MSELQAKIEQLLRDFWQQRAIAISDSPDSTEELGAPLDSITSMEAIMDIDELSTASCRSSRSSARAVTRTKIRSSPR